MDSKMETKVYSNSFQPIWWSIIKRPFLQNKWPLLPWKSAQFFSSSKDSIKHTKTISISITIFHHQCRQAALQHKHLAHLLLKWMCRIQLWKTSPSQLNRYSQKPLWKRKRRRKRRKKRSNSKCQCKIWLHLLLLLHHLKHQEDSQPLHNTKPSFKLTN